MIITACFSIEITATEWMHAVVNGSSTVILLLYIYIYMLWMDQELTSRFEVDQFEPYYGSFILLSWSWCVHFQLEIRAYLLAILAWAKPMGVATWDGECVKSQALLGRSRIWPKNPWTNQQTLPTISVEVEGIRIQFFVILAYGVLKHLWANPIQVFEWEDNLLLLANSNVLLV